MYMMGVGLTRRFSLPNKENVDDLTSAESMRLSFPDLSGGWVNLYKPKSHQTQSFGIEMWEQSRSEPTSIVQSSERKNPVLPHWQMRDSKGDCPDIGDGCSIFFGHTRKRGSIRIYVCPWFPPAPSIHTDSKYVTWVTELMIAPS